MSILNNKVFLLSYPDASVMKFLKNEGGIVVLPDNCKTVYYDAVVFPTGEDIAPFLYGQIKYKKTTCNIVRDMQENSLYRSLPTEVPKIGIGRGAHLLCVLNGGTLWQNVTGHQTNHNVLDYASGEYVFVTSKHHQEMKLPTHGIPTMGAIEADKKENASKLVQYDIGLDRAKKNTRDIEGALFEETASYCFQPRISASPLYDAEKKTNDLFIHQVEVYLSQYFSKTYSLSGGY